MFCFIKTWHLWTPQVSDPSFYVFRHQWTISVWASILMKITKYSVSPEKVIHNEMSCSCWLVNVWLFLTKQMMLLNPKVFGTIPFALRIVLKHCHNIRGDFYAGKIINCLFLWETAGKRCKESFQWSLWVHSVTAVKIYTFKRFGGVVSC